MQSFSTGNDSSADAQSTPLAPGQGGNSLVMTAITNLFQTIVGSGLLALPAVLANGGVGIGTVNVAIMGALSCMGFLSIGHVCHTTGAHTYRDAWKRTIGRWAITVDIAIFLETTIVMVSFVMIAIDYLGILLDSLFGVSANRVVVALAMAVPILLPLGLQPRLHNLRWSSAFGNCAVLFTMCYVIADSISNNRLTGYNHLNDATFLSDDTPGIFRATSVMASAYIAHYNAPDILAELTPHPKQWCSFVVTVMVGFGCAGSFYGAFAVAGYARFGPNVQSNVLLEYEMNKTIMLVWFCMLVTCIASFALHVKPSRDGLSRVLRLQLYKGHLDADVVRIPFVTVSTSIVSAVVVAGILCTDLSMVLGIRGALLAFPVSLVIPGLMLINCPNTGKCYRYVCGGLLVFFGLGNSVLGLYCAFNTRLPRYDEESLIKEIYG